MSNSIGVIFHNNWADYSPLFYSHYGANIIPIELKEFCKNYKCNHNLDTNYGHLYECCHIIVNFISMLRTDMYMRIESLNDETQTYITNNHEYLNCFDSGCLLVNVAFDKFGDLDTDNWDIVEDNVMKI